MKNLINENTMQKKKVFIVDDHCILREGLAHLINSEEDLMIYGEADNASEALKAVADCKPDIAIVDISLGDGSGIRLIENLMYLYPGLPVLVLSMHDESTHAERCLTAGARGYIMKQEPSGKLIAAIRKILGASVSNDIPDGIVYVPAHFPHSEVSAVTRLPGNEGIYMDAVRVETS